MDSLTAEGADLSHTGDAVVDDMNKRAEVAPARYHKLLARDVRHVVVRLPKHVRRLIHDHSLVLAGGFIRSVVASEEIVDVDLFGATKDALEEASRLLANDLGSERSYTLNAITVKGRPYVQFITRWLFPDAKTLVESFDYTVARAAIWFDKEKDAWDSVCDELYYPDLAARRLRYMSPQRNEDAGGSVMRMRKFLRRGYVIDQENMASVIARLVKGLRVPEIESVDEESIAMLLRGLLLEVDPLIAIGDVDETNEEESPAVANA